MVLLVNGIVFVFLIGLYGYAHVRSRKPDDDYKRGSAILLLMGPVLMFLCDMIGRGPIIPVSGSVLVFLIGLDGYACVRSPGLERDYARGSATLVLWGIVVISVVDVIAVLTGN